MFFGGAALVFGWQLLDTRPQIVIADLNDSLRFNPISLNLSGVAVNTDEMRWSFWEKDSLRVAIRGLTIKGDPIVPAGSGNHVTPENVAAWPAGP